MGPLSTDSDHEQMGIEETPCGVTVVSSFVFAVVVSQSNYVSYQWVCREQVDNKATTVMLLCRIPLVGGSCSASASVQYIATPTQVLAYNHTIDKRCAMGCLKCYRLFAPHHRQLRVLHAYRVG